MRAVRALVGLHVIGLGALLSRAFAHGTADEVAKKWSNNLGNAQSEMQAGVQRVRVAPGVAAAAAKQKWVAKMTSAATQAKWEQNTRAVGLGQWQQSMLELGIQRAAAGAQAKQAKMAHAMTKLLPFIDGLQGTVKSMPDVTPQDREQRALAWMRGMRQFPGVGA